MGPAVVGLDPREGALPDSIAPEAAPADRILDFYGRTLPVLARHVPAVKPNIAYFERFGANGFAAYERICKLARELGLVVVGDVKRGDIGTTAEAYADLHLKLADAITVQPYLGSDSIDPFLRACEATGGGLFVLVRTSNPSAAEFQDLATATGRLCEVVGKAVDAWGSSLPTVSGYSPVGAVVGATSADDIRILRGVMPRAWLLLPGVGAQGATVEACSAAFDADGLGGLISQSRSIMQCFAPADEDWLDKVESAAREFSQRAAAVAAGSGSPQP